MDSSFPPEKTISRGVGGGGGCFENCKELFRMSLNNEFLHIKNEMPCYLAKYAGAYNLSYTCTYLLVCMDMFFVFEDVCIVAGNYRS